jgi:alkylation response protein AidB-like acyl-CoA dehydrogenase
VKWIRLAKLLTAELQGNVLGTCLQFHDGYGCMDECDASISRIYRGSNEIVRMLIARSL